MRFLTIGYGVQGKKRTAVAGSSSVGVVDPVYEDASYKKIEDVPLSLYDAAFVCTPDGAKKDILTYLLENGKHVLVEKPLFLGSEDELRQLKSLAESRKLACYTAYNHRFEPHFIRMHDLIKSGCLGKIYEVRMFYGNGTARLVKNSVWRDRGYGVLPDLGSHLLDTFLFWFGGYGENFSVVRASRYENDAFDYVNFCNKPEACDSLFAQFEMTLLSWRNHFTADVFAEKGTAHISSLCKWGPSTFSFRKRVLPSGKPPEESVTLVQDDPTWKLEYEAFLAMCEQGVNNLENDIWIQNKLSNLYQNF